MKLAVIGSRTYINRQKIFEELTLFHLEKSISLIISGGAKGADLLAQEWAQSAGVETQIFLPDWKKFGKSAGVIRNKNIIDSCEYCIAFWDGISKGTLNSINLAKAKKISLKIIKN